MNSNDVWNNQNGPLIGILTARKKNGLIGGNTSLFIALQKKLISQDGVSFIFTIDGVKEDSIEGYTFLPEKNLWSKITVPYPDLVYNRIPFRKTEEEENCLKFFSCLKEKNIPFFNPCFIDKYELYKLMENHPVLQSFLPKTIKASHKKKLCSFLIKHQSIYLKPAQSARGKGIYRIKLDEKLQIQLAGMNRQDTYDTFQHFWFEWEKELSKKNYLAQEEIKSVQFNGKRFDFRILAHADKNDYFVTGVGIRQSQEQEITTHIPNGGRIIPYKQIQTKEHDQFIRMIVEETGRTLSNQFGFFGEFSIDAGLSQTGNYYLYEVNSKPMSFDETEIEEKKISQLCRLFLQLTNFEN